MSCYGETEFHANDEALTWEEFRDRTLEISENRGEVAFVTYVKGVSENAWAHVLSENFFTPEAAERHLWEFYCSDIRK